ncbi:MAG: hypothetical protein GEU93_08675 [Propionibacteriales bacterium]|nr:hypothetical protein [Propionibacteriales bacterium]
MGERQVVKVSVLQVEAAQLAVKVAKKFGWEPNPLMVRIANAKPADEDDDEPEESEPTEAEESEPAAEGQCD